MIGRTLGHYQITEKLGEGGMGVVYRAHDEQLDRDVAIKVLPAASFDDPSAKARLLREARTASRLNHPHICTIHEVGEHDGQAFIAMELVEGRRLSSLLERGALPVDEVQRYGIQLADALAHAHGRSIVHRDLKSANVIITPEGRAKVLDFGLAKHQSAADLSKTVTQGMDTLTAPGMVVGTLAYMAPEQLRGRPADTRSDIWALGVVLYEMASGRRPFQGNTGFELSSAIIGQAPPPIPPGPMGPLPPELRTIIERCLAKDPAERYQSSGDVRAAMEAVQSGGPLPAWIGRRRGLSRGMWLALAAVLGTALIAFIAVLVGLNLEAVRDRLLGRSAAPRFRSIAVLPVANLSGDPDQEYFTDGMTDALITDISKIGALKVTSRTSVMRYKGLKKPLPEIARELKVDTVLEASALREGSRVRVMAQLIEAATEQNLWAESYVRELTSILAIQSDVARTVARTIRVKVRPEVEARLANARAANPATYESYLRGMFYLNKSSMADTEKGLAYLHEALEKDPADPLTHAGLALGYIEMAHGAEAREDSLQRAKAAATTALKLDDTLAEVLTAMAFVEGYWEWRWDDAFRDIERALDANPSLAIAYYHRSWFNFLFGRTKEAIEDHKRAQELDPFNPLHTAWLGELYRHEKRYEEAAAEALKSIEMAPKFPPGHYVLGLVYQDQGSYEKAIAAMQKAGEVAPRWRWVLGPTYVAAGRTEQARRLLDELNRLKPDPWVAFWRAMNYTALGENDEAFRWLNYEPHAAWQAWVRVLTWCAPLRKDPRFPELLRRMNLPSLPKS